MKGFGELLTALENASDKDAEQWAERYRASPAFKNNLAGQQKEKHADYRLDERPLLRRRAESAPAPAEPAPIKVSAVRQFFALTSRGLKLLRRDRFGLPLLLGAPLLGALGELFLTNTYMYDPNRGDPAQIAISLGLLVFFVLLAAGFMWLREIRKEAQIIRRESQAGLRLGPYILSKAWIVALFALYQSLIWTGIHFYTTSVPGGLRVALFFFITLALLAFIGGLIGLVVSSLTQTEMGAGLLLALLVVPQLAFSGALLTSRQLGPLGRSLKAVVPSRFAFEALVLAGGHLKDLQGDACLGSNLFTKCSYPGIRKYQVSEMDQAAKQIQGDSERYRGLLSAGPNGLFNRWMVLVAISAILAAILAGVEKRKFSLG